MKFFTAGRLAAAGLSVLLLGLAACSSAGSSVPASTHSPAATHRAPASAPATAAPTTAAPATVTPTPAPTGTAAPLAISVPAWCDPHLPVTSATSVAQWLGGDTGYPSGILSDLRELTGPYSTDANENAVNQSLCGDIGQEKYSPPPQDASMYATALSYAIKGYALLNNGPDPATRAWARWPRRRLPGRGSSPLRTS